MFFSILGQVKTIAFFLEHFKWFPITREQLTMLLEGNTCESQKTFEEFLVTNFLNAKSYFF